MPSIEHRLQLLNAAPAPQVVSVLSSALLHATTAELEPLCLALVGTGRRDATITVLRHVHRLEPQGIEAVAEATTSLESAVAGVLAGGWPRAAQNAVDLIERRRDATALAPAAEVLPLLDDELAGRVAAVIRSVTLAHVGPTGRRGADPAVCQALDRAVATALDTHRSHRQPDVLIAAGVLACRPGPRLHRILDDPAHPAAAALRGLARRVDEPLVRRNLLRWLGGPMRRTAARGLELARSPEAVVDVLGDAHLLLSGERRRAIRQIDRPARCLPDRSTALELPEAIQARLPALINAMDLSSVVRIKALTLIATLPNDRARLEALRVLASHRSPEAIEAVTALASDRDPAVASMAVQRLRAEGLDDATLWTRLEHCETAGLARQARAELSRLSPEGFLERWLDLDRPTRLAAAHLLAERDPEGLARVLAGVLARRAPRGERLLAIDLMRRLSLGADVEAATIAATSDRDPRVASAAVAALADSTSEPGHRALTQALGHHDPRVVANAVEALARRDRAASAALLGPLVATGQNRPRGNAIRALMRHRPPIGLEGLRVMLGDRDPLHRVSAIWVARQARAMAVRDDLRRLASGDRIAVIRERAAEAARRLDRMAAVTEGARP